MWERLRRMLDNHLREQRHINAIKQEYLNQLMERQLRYQGEDLIQAVQPGKRKFLDRNTSTTFELEHKYGTHVWIYVAVSIIAEKSSIPNLVLQDEEGKTIEGIDVLPSEPNSVYTWSEMEQMITIWLELTGNAYIYHDFEDDTYWPMRPSRMKAVIGDDNRTIKGYAYNRRFNNAYSLDGVPIDPTKKEYWMYDDPDVVRMTKESWDQRLNEYREYVFKGEMPMQVVREKDDWFPLETHEVLHFRYVSPTSEVYGMSPLIPLFTNLESDLYARQWNKSFFENGAMPPGILVIPKKFPEDAFKALQKKFYDMFSGTKNRGKPFILQGGGEGATYTPFPNQHKDLEFLNLLNWSRDEILAVYNVPHVMANAQLTSSHSSSLSPGMEVLRKIFWQDTIFPKQQMKAEVWNKHLEYDPKKYPRMGYDYSDIQDLKPDYEKLVKTAALGLKSGMTVQEVRKLILNLPEDWDGDLFLPSNVMILRDNNEVM